MLAGPKNGKGWPICNIFNSYINCSFNSNRLDILDMESFLLATRRDHSYYQALVTHI